MKTFKVNKTIFNMIQCTCLRTYMGKIERNREALTDRSNDKVTDHNTRTNNKNSYQHAINRL